jgi:hypothetical protein
LFSTLEIFSAHAGQDPFPDIETILEMDTMDFTSSAYIPTEAGMFAIYGTQGGAVFGAFIEHNHNFHEVFTSLTAYDDSMVRVPHDIDEFLNRSNISVQLTLEELIRIRDFIAEHFVDARQLAN